MSCIDQRSMIFTNVAICSSIYKVHAPEQQRMEVKATTAKGCPFVSLTICGTSTVQSTPSSLLVRNPSRALHRLSRISYARRQTKVNRVARRLPKELPVSSIV